MGKRKGGKDVYTMNPEPINDQSIGKITAVRGGGIYECVVEGGEGSSVSPILVLLAPVYQKRIWVKMGSFVIIEPFEEKSKVAAQIQHVLLLEDIKHLKKIGKWPACFQEHQDASPLLDISGGGGDAQNNMDAEKKMNHVDVGGEEEDDDADLFVNNNRMMVDEDDN